MARLLALAVLLVLLLAAGAQAADLAATQRVLAREMARSGAYSGAYVVDVGTGQELYSYRADVGRVAGLGREALHRRRRAAQLRRRRPPDHERAGHGAAGRDGHDRR